MKKRIVSILLTLCLILVQLPVLSVAAEEEARVTGLSITVDGVTYTEGNVTIKPDSTVIYTVTGTNLHKPSSEYSLEHTIGVTSLISSGTGWDADETGTSASRDYSDRIHQFVLCDNFRVSIVLASGERMYTDIYLTYDDGSTEADKAEITGLSLVVDGVTYTEGLVTMRPEQEVVIIVHGNYLRKADENLVLDTPGVYVYVDRMTLLPDGTRSQTASSAWFEGGVEYPITYTNDAWATTIDSGITVTFATEGSTGPAEITGIALTVDGVTYTEGNVIVRPNSTVSFTVTGLNLDNVDQSQIIDTPMAYLPLHSIGLQEDGTYLYVTYASVFIGGSNYQITYTNDSWATSIPTDIYVTYQENPDSAAGALTLDADATVWLSLTGDLYIDLNGFDLSGTIITNGFKVYGKDSTTDGYTCDNIGYFTCVDENGSPIVPERMHIEADKQYLAICTEGRYSFHRFFAGITHMSLAPTVVGLGYKAAVYGDEMVFAELAQTNAFSFRVQLEGNEPVYLHLNGDQLTSGEPITLRIRNYDVENYSEHKLYTQAILTLNDGTVIETKELAGTFRWLTEKVNANHADYTVEQLTAFRAMLQTFTVVEEWNIPNLL